MIALNTHHQYDEKAMPPAKMMLGPKRPMAPAFAALDFTPLLGRMILPCQMPPVAGRQFHIVDDDMTIKKTFLWSRPKKIAKTYGFR